MIKIGVVGVGNFGRWHLKNYQSLPNAELVGFYDINPERATYIADEFQAKAYPSLDKLLEDCEAVSIVVPTHAHYEVARVAIARGRHLLCEKPFMSTIAEADEIIQLAKAKNLILQVGHVERFNPALTGLEQYHIDPLFIESHRIAPFRGRGTDVAVVLELMIHDIDLVLALVSAPIVQVEASGAPVLTDNIDIANARLRFGNGCVANVTASRISNKQMRKLRIFQRDAYFSIDMLTGLTEVYSLSRDSGPLPSDTVQITEMPDPNGTPKRILYHTRQTEQGNALLNELDSFIKAIQTGQPPRVSGEDGKRALEVAVQIVNSIQSDLRNIV
ncbi:MAG: Gfo/Idh/MocA family oxidoreductase [Candidatus Marinimicrobia bacterium]|jgi:predicted dehydrogenase|nr:Gfo/Idh/MocA family oxidoreductase [Candidatus Neomarinimicrobiota bacterium]MCK9561029.1 Gfo/Idh/MocA family oxidoreductase [Candidatus Neomarinimicrobiota bacterium]MDD5231201.1 Gfo/Idh/MocA family oxidoreductase [Candidatus Neomarinimicrobiota bacterium]MDD5540564.1 Gfo/Idh/MocA family oxidoreductase [Candidatus Neomarinimicrobiota bacterium]